MPANSRSVVPELPQSIVTQAGSDGVNECQPRLCTTNVASCSVPLRTTSTPRLSKARTVARLSWPSAQPRIRLLPWASAANMTAR